MTRPTAQLANDLFAAIERGDVDAVADCYADDVVVWHNTDGIESTKAQNLAVLTGFVARVPTRRYENRRLIETSDGFVQQHLLVGVHANGKRVELPACIVCSVKDGKITRLDEYLDSAQVGAFIAN